MTKSQEPSEDSASNPSVEPSADLFDTQPELLEELIDFELDEVFEGLLL